MEAEFIRKESIFLLLLLIIAVLAARRLRVPYPILLTIVGGILCGLPIFPNIALDPNLVFFVFLPPLLFAAGWQLSWREFQANFTRILRLAVGLVIFTILVLIAARRWLLPGFDWRRVMISFPCLSISGLYQEDAFMSASGARSRRTSRISSRRPVARLFKRRGLSDCSKLLSAASNTDFLKSVSRASTICFVSGQLRMIGAPHFGSI
jgi:hypothetical protein